MPADSVRVGGLACQTPRPQERAGTARGTERVISPAHHIGALRGRAPFEGVARDAKRLALRGRLSPRGNCLLEMRSEEHTSELQSLVRISYAVFCLKKKKHTQQ